MKRGEKGSLKNHLNKAGGVVNPIATGIQKKDCLI
jgi:hypothetical protein